MNLFRTHRRTTWYLRGRVVSVARPASSTWVISERRIIVMWVSVEERIRWLLRRAREAEARGEAELAHRFRAMANDLGPAPAARRAM
jgi:hypothetical protein